MAKLLCLILGGVFGTCSRYYLDGFIYQKLGLNFPWGTFVVNLTGCLLIGFFGGLGEGKHILTQETRILLITGFCGAYTTFSSWILETSNLVSEGQMALAAFNVAGSFAFGYILFRIGMLLGRLI